MHLGETMQKSHQKKMSDKQTDFMVNPGHKKHKNKNSEKSKSVDQKTEISTDEQTDRKQI